MDTEAQDREFDYEEYERACKEIREKNEACLDVFEQWLQEKGLSEKTIRNHLSNVDFYINEFLLLEDAHPMEDGCDYSMLDEFFGYFFPRKCLWSTPATIRQNIASFKKFYKCMLEKGEISKESYEDLTQTIKECKQEWLDFCERYNDPNVAFEDLDLFPF